MSLHSISNGCVRATHSSTEVSATSSLLEILVVFGVVTTYFCLSQSHADFLLWFLLEVLLF